MSLEGRIPVTNAQQIPGYRIVEILDDMAVGNGIANARIGTAIASARNDLHNKADQVSGDAVVGCTFVMTSEYVPGDFGADHYTVFMTGAIVRLEKMGATTISAI